MRVVFFGSGAFGVPSLAAIDAEHELLAVVSQPDRRAGRGSKLTPTPVSDWVLENIPRTPLYRPESINEPASIEQVRAHKADAWVVIAYGQKLSQPLLADRFAINLHASLLPRWRGAAPIHAAILAGDTITGNSVITLADRMDAGLILGQSKRTIDPALTTGELHDLLAADGPGLISQVLTDHAAGTLNAMPQDESKVTIAPKLSRNEAWLDFNDDAHQVRRRIHGLTPWPGVAVKIGTVEMRLLRVSVCDEPIQSDVQQKDAAPGTLIDAHRGIIRCGDNTTIQMIEIQPVGKKPMTWTALTNGRSIETGTAVIPKYNRP